MTLEQENLSYSLQKSFTKERRMIEMYIHEAAKKAMDERKYITTPEFAGSTKIKPTNESGNCVVMMHDGSHPSKYGWQPTANDLIRDDWIIVD
jgi:hypothetical protein